MSNRFDYFVICGAMRTGSNFLESNINQIYGLTVHGEAFNPYLIGGLDKSELLGMTLEMRQADPVRLIELIKSTGNGTAGFRYFADHDPRAYEHFMPDERCAKIILTRNPLDSYISELLAWSTDQWRLLKGETRKDMKVTFKADEFQAHVERQQEFQVRILNALQTTGQTAFYLAYEDVSNIDVINGIAKFLGSKEKLEALSKSMRRQNPGSMRDKVENYDEMVAALADMDDFNLTRTPNFEPRRGPSVPSYVAAQTAPVMYLPLKGGPEQQIQQWLATLDGTDTDGLRRDFNQKELRKWKRQNTGHRSFTVLRHPVARAHAVFCDYILSTGPQAYGEIREHLRTSHDVSVPYGEADGTYDRRAHRTAFMAFLQFLKKNLAGQTGVRVDPTWALQSQLLQGFGSFALPDMVLREETLTQGLEQLCAQVGLPMSALPQEVSDAPIPLSDIYDDEVEAATKAIYQRDYMMFGYKAWKNT